MGFRSSAGSSEKWRLPSNHANLIYDLTTCGLADWAFDADKRLAAEGDPSEIDRVVPFESFRAEIEGGGAGAGR
jgi:hypothetical protein